MRYTRKEIKRRIKRANQLHDWIESSWLSARLYRKDRKTRKRFQREWKRLVESLDRRGLFP